MLGGFAQVSGCRVRCPLEDTLTGKPTRVWCGVMFALAARSRGDENSKL